MTSRLYISRPWLSRTCAATLLSASFCALACEGSADHNESVEPSDIGSAQQKLQERFDGETLLRGFFFGVGPVAALLPEIWGKAPLSRADAAEAYRSGMSELAPEDAQADEELARRVESGTSSTEQAAEEVAKLALSQLAEQNPRFSRQFEKSIYSGDPIAVSAAIEEAAKSLSAILKVEVIGLDPGRYGADWIFNENIAVNVNAALNVNVAVNVDTAYNKTQFWGLPPIDRESMLRNQMMMATITQRFAF